MKRPPAVSPSSDDDLEITVSVGEEEGAGPCPLTLKKGRPEGNTIYRLLKYKFPTIDLLDSPPAEGNEVDFDED